MTDDWPAAGTILAFRYRLVSRLQTGGMAEIWHAEDELLARPVALKLPSAPHPARAGALQLAWREARMGARLSHPNIAAVHDYDEAVRPEGSVAPFVVMELLAGETLAARLARAPLPWCDAATIGAAVAGALTAAHANGVVHRDVKPGNVMLTPTGIKILDFGISAVTGEPDDDETGATFGTPAYVAPERLDGKPAEPATDVYGLGVLLFEMVTGEPPYPVDTWEELAQARAGGPVALPAALPPAFRELVASCLMEQPEQRPTAAEVGAALSRLAGETGGDRPRPSTDGSGLGTGRPGQGTHDTAHPSSVTADALSGPTAGLSDLRQGLGDPRQGLRDSQQRFRAPQRGVGDQGHGRGEARQDLGGPGYGRGDPGQGFSGFGPGSGGTASPPGGGTAVRARRLRSPRRRRLVLWSGIVALAVSMLAVFAAMGSSRQLLDAGRAPAASLPPASPPPAGPPPAGPSAVAPQPPGPLLSTPATTPASTSPRIAIEPDEPDEPLDTTAAIARLRSAVEAGRDRGQIRPDVAVDLLNLLRPLGRAGPGEADDKLAELRRKLDERADEGSVNSARAEVLRSRLTDLEAAFSSG